jgi:hypothetical protein
MNEEKVSLVDTTLMDDQRSIRQIGCPFCGAVAVGPGKAHFVATDPSTGLRILTCGSGPGSISRSKIIMGTIGSGLLIALSGHSLTLGAPQIHVSILVQTTGENS